MKNDSIAILGSLLSKRYRLLHHLLYILAIFSFWFLYNYNNIHDGVKIFKLFLYSLSYVVIAYFNLYVLFEKYFLLGKLKTYFIFSLLSFFIGYIIQRLIYIKFWEVSFIDLIKSVSVIDKTDNSASVIVGIIINMITFSMFIGIGMSVKVIKMWLHSQERISSLESENLRAELNSLKSQLSPHFLFNTFNNLYVLAKTRPSLAAEMILGLSDLMRYQLNESFNDHVPLQKEIEHITNFLNLEKLRKDNMDIQINFDKQDIQNISVQPLLLTALVENAVKHGSQQVDSGFIHVQIETSKDALTFKVSNNKSENYMIQNKQVSGKGLNNLKKRLQLSYPDKHLLELSDKKNTYFATLQIQFS